MEYIELGSAPSEEDCVNVNKDGDYIVAMKAECMRYKKLLEDLFPVPENVIGYFKVKSFPHDFGTYMEVVAVYDPGDEKSIDWAFNVESRLPEKWDNQTIISELLS